MTISSAVKSQLFADDRKLIRIQPRAKRSAKTKDSTTTTSPAWTTAEHERFLQGLELFPSGPWKHVAEYVGTKSVRQTMSHAQKYRQKIARQKERAYVEKVAQELIMTASVIGLIDVSDVYDDDSEDMDTSSESSLRWKMGSKASDLNISAASFAKFLHPANCEDEIKSLLDEFQPLMNLSGELNAFNLAALV